MRILLALSFVLALAVPVHASACVPTTSTGDEDTIVVDIGYQEEYSLVPRYQAWDRCNEPSVDEDQTWTVIWPDMDLSVTFPQPVDLGECILSYWHYYESNGIEGLQRGDEMHDDTCGGLIRSDTIPF